MTHKEQNIQTFIKNIVDADYASAEKSLENCVQDKIKNRIQEYTNTETFKKFTAGE